MTMSMSPSMLKCVQFIFSPTYAGPVTSKAPSLAAFMNMIASPLLVPSGPSRAEIHIMYSREGIQQG